MAQDTYSGKVYLGDAGGVDERLIEQSAGGGVVEFRKRGQGKPLRVAAKVFDIDTSVLVVCERTIPHLCPVVMVCGPESLRM